MSAGYWAWTTMGLWAFAIGWTVGSFADSVPWGSFVVAIVWTGMAVHVVRRERQRR